MLILRGSCLIFFIIFLSVYDSFLQHYRIQGGEHTEDAQAFVFLSTGFVYISHMSYDFSIMMTDIMTTGDVLD